MFYKNKLLVLTKYGHEMIWLVRIIVTYIMVIVFLVRNKQKLPKNLWKPFKNMQIE